MSAARPPLHPERHRHYRYYDLVTVGFVTVLLCSNLIGPSKACRLSLPGTDWSLTFGAGNIFFPIGYIFGDILTEVYGYARARKVIWAGFGALAFASLMSWVIIQLPPDPGESHNAVIQPALETCFGNTGRIVAASLFAFWCGDFANAYILARMKLLTRGRYLWTRTIASTAVGQGIDSFLFYPIAFFGIWEHGTLLTALLVNWGIKVSVEVLFTPLTYLIVFALKRAEREDFFDTDTQFTPFSIAD
jgi:hypothetical protein